MNRIIVAILGVMLVAPAAAQGDEDCPAGSHEVSRDNRGDEIVVRCQCDEALEVRGNQCVAATAETDPVPGLLTVAGRDLVTGRAFGNGDDVRAHARSVLKSPPLEARVAIGLWQASRGYYGRARRSTSAMELFKGDPVLADFDARLAALEAEQWRLTGNNALQLVVIGEYDWNGLGALTPAVAGPLLLAHLDARTGNFARAIAFVGGVATRMPDNPGPRQAVEYLERLRKAEETGRDPIVVSAYAALTLGLHLVDGGDGIAANRLLTEAGALLGRAGRRHDADLAFDIAELARDGSITTGSAPAGVYDYASETDILLDALDYGRGDWRRAIRFLDDAGGGAPHDPAIAAAAFRIRALSKLPQKGLRGSR